MNAFKKFVRGNLVPLVVLVATVIAAFAFPFKAADAVSVKGIDPNTIIAFFGMSLSQFFTWLASQIVVGGGIGALLVFYIITPIATWLEVPDSVTQVFTGLVFTAIANALTALVGAVAPAYLPLPLWQIVIVLVAVAVNYYFAKVSLNAHPRGTSAAQRALG